MDLTTKHQQEAILSPTKSVKSGRPICSTTSLLYADLLTLTLEGEDGWYKAGIGELGLGNADYRLLLNNRVIMERSERDGEDWGQSDDTIEMKKGDTLRLQWRYDGDDEGRKPSARAAKALFATLFIEEDVW